MTRKKIIKQHDESPSIKRKPEENYPVFCFRYLQQYSYHKCTNPGFFIEFIERLQKLGQLGWNAIYGSGRHAYGIEKIPIKQLKVKKFPSIVSEEVKELTVFRATGGKLPFLGIRIDDTFQVIFIETMFGDIYDHN